MKPQPLPPKWQVPDADPETVMAAYLGTIETAIRHHPRSLQKAIGPSEIGADCMRRLAYKILGIDERPCAPNWKATIGTAVHAWLEGIFDVDDGGSNIKRWYTETRVDVGEIPGLGHITGSCDLYDRMTGTVLDHKVVGPAQLRKYRVNGPSAQYRTQAHLYGRGWVRAGLPATHVAICFLPRNGELNEAYLWHEPYDEQVALDGLNRLAGVAALAARMGTDMLPLMPTADQYCVTCPFHRPGSNDLAGGCPGHPRDDQPATSPLSFTKGNTKGKTS